MVTARRKRTGMKSCVRKANIAIKNPLEETTMQTEATVAAVQEEPKPIQDSPAVPVSEEKKADKLAEALVDSRFARDLRKFIDPSDVKDPSGNWVYGMIDPLHRDHVGLQFWEPITWDIVKKEGLEIPFNPMIRSSAEQKGDNLVRQGTMIYARVKREIAEEIRRRNTEVAILKVKSVDAKNLAKNLNAELVRRGIAKDYRMVVLDSENLLIGKR